MTEAEWLACDDPAAGARFVARRVGDRKLRLFYCACCARVLDGTPPSRRLFRKYYAGSFEQLGRALSIVEQFAEGLADAALAEARELARDSAYVPGSIDYGGETGLDRELAAVVAAGADRPDAAAVLAACWRATVSQSPRTPEEHSWCRMAEAEWQTDVLRDIVGNPFRSPAFPADWRTETVLVLARQIYESRDFSPLPILADALQDAGCADADVLDHCRGSGPHVRGCWVIDRVLGKA